MSGVFRGPFPLWSGGATIGTRFPCRKTVSLPRMGRCCYC